MKIDMLNSNEIQVGHVIKKLRKERGMSQKELSQATGISLSAIAMYETGERRPNKVMTDRLLEYFDVDMNYLYGKCQIKNSIYNETNIAQVPLYKTIHFKEDGMLTGDIVCRMALPLVVIDEQKTYFAIVNTSGNQIFSIKCGDVAVFERDAKVKYGDIGYFRLPGEDMAVIRKIIRYSDDEIILVDGISEGNNIGYNDNIRCYGVLTNVISKI